MAKRRKILRLTGASFAGGLLAGQPAVAGDGPGIEGESFEANEEIEDGLEDVYVKNLHSAAHAIDVDIVDAESGARVAGRSVGAASDEAVSLEDVIPTGTDRELELVVKLGGQEVATADASWVASEPDVRRVGVWVSTDHDSRLDTPTVDADLEVMCTPGGVGA